MFCSNCGKKLEKEDKFCKSCGFPNRDYQENNNNNNNNNNNIRFDSLNQNSNNNQNNFNSYMNNQNNNANNFNTSNNNQNGYNMPINNQNTFDSNNMVSNNQPIEQKQGNIEALNTSNKNSSNSLIDRILHGENRNLYIVIGILSIIALVCIILVTINFVNKLNDNSNDNYLNNNDNNSKTETINLGGTIYQVPSGYKIEKAENNQYALSNSIYKVSIQLQVNSYNDYKAHINEVIQGMKAALPSDFNYINYEIATIGGREYSIVQFANNNETLLAYYTNSNYTGYSYFGMIYYASTIYDKNAFLDISAMLLKPSSGFDNSDIGDVYDDTFDFDEFLEK